MCDSAHVMRGHMGGLVTLLQQEVSQSILDVGGCVLHHIHNACSRAMSALGEDIEELVDYIYNYLRYSKAATEFTKTQEILELEPLKYLRRVETRWLQIKAVVDRYIQLYVPLQEFFRNLPDSEKWKPKPKRILERLEAPETLAYLGFVSFALIPFKRFEIFSKPLSLLFTFSIRPCVTSLLTFFGLLCGQVKSIHLNESMI